MNFRAPIFWTIDRLKGSPLKKAYQYTSAILEAEDRSQARAKTTEQLQKLLTHACTTTKFYKNKNYKALKDFPIVDKNSIRTHYEDFFSAKYHKKNCKLVSTSGSTGSPFSLYQNPDKVRKVQADNIYFSSKSNFKIGDFLVFIRIWPDTFSHKLKWSFWLKHFMPWNILDLSENGMDRLLLRLNKKRKPISFLTYPTALEKLCKHLIKRGENPMTFKTKSIITISEALNTFTREQTLKYFGVTPLSRYSNNETGIMAQQISAEDQRFRINDSSYVIEIFDINTDKILGFGETGRIVITDLFNFATPLIRYDTGDIGVMEKDKDGQLYFTEISGRKVDQLYNTKGQLISSHLSLRLMDYGEFRQFQLVQKSKTEYHINLNTDRRVDEAQLISDYKVHFGQDAIITINYVDDIPLLASGKRREVVNEYYK